MDKDMQGKIRDVLKQQEYCERDVVYFLVESYKLLERKYEKAFGEGKYSRIKFYRNWACHARLNGDAAKVFTDFITLIKERRNVSNALGQFDWSYTMSDKIRDRFRLYGPIHLRQEIEEFAAEIQYNDTFNWESFRVNLYGVIRDIPLVVKEGDDVFFTFECVVPLTPQKYDDFTIAATIPGMINFSLVLDDCSL
ncbi:MAG: hypothetical protein RIQ54_33 [Candidatus Parcubacteria bacterium]|jgi:hypothetical protein